MNVIENSSCADVAKIEIPKPKGLWFIHPRTLLASQTIHRAEVGAVIPSNIVLLDTNGCVLMDETSRPICKPLVRSTSDWLDTIYNSGSTQKLLISGNAIIQTSLGAEVQAGSFDASNNDQVQLLNTLCKESIPQPSNVQRVFDWTFTTSRYASFVHHLNSWSGIVRDLCADSGSPAGNLLDLGILNQLENILESREIGFPSIIFDGSLEGRQKREKEAQDFDTVLSLFNLDDRELPKELTFTLLNDRNRSYGLLFESPEPLPATRVSFSIKNQSTSINSILVASPVIKIVALGLGNTDEPSDLVKEYIDLVLMESSTLHGLSLQIYDSTDSWHEYYKFISNDIFPEGSIIRIHTGEAINDQTPDPEAEHFYCGQSARNFSGKKIRLKLIDANDALVHDRTFLINGFKAMTFRVLRNRDDTRMLIFFNDKNSSSTVGEVRLGTMQILWKYFRKISEQKNISDPQKMEPILRRLGSISDEQAVLDLSIH